MSFRTAPSFTAAALHAPNVGERHIVDQLIEERALKLSKHPLWPVMRPVLYRMFHYDQAVTLANTIAALPGWAAFEHISSLLSIPLRATGLENIPTRGGVIIAPNHPTGIADGIAMFDALKQVRKDLIIFANRDALRVAPQFSDLIIPVEWRAGEKTHAKSRDTLEMTARAFAAERPVVLFPSGRIAFWNEGKLTERPWQNTVVALARRYQVPVIPAHISARNSGLFYFLSKYSTELRDMTVFHELLNKKGFAFAIHFGKPVAPEALTGDLAEATAALQEHTVNVLPMRPDAELRPQLIAA